jgi:hypothetical protein
MFPMWLRATGSNCSPKVKQKTLIQELLKQVSQLKSLKVKIIGENMLFFTSSAKDYNRLKAFVEQNKLEFHLIIICSQQPL